MGMGPRLEKGNVTFLPCNPTQTRAFREGEGYKDTGMG